MVMKYETWIRGHEIIEGGGSGFSSFLEGLNFELPGLGVLLDFASRVLGWALGKIWDAIPHENEAHSPTQGWLPIHEPGKIFYVQDPRWVVDNKANYEELVRKAREAGINVGDLMPLKPAAGKNTPDTQDSFDKFIKPGVIIPVGPLVNDEFRKRPIQHPRVSALIYPQRAVIAGERDSPSMRSFYQTGPNVAVNKVGF
jgi:hypothetical protein